MRHALDGLQYLDVWPRRSPGACHALLRRAEAVLPLLGSDVPERVRLLAWCYAEVEEESLLLEAEAIVAGWARPLASDRLLAADEVALMRESLIINP